MTDLATGVGKKGHGGKNTTGGALMNSGATTGDEQGDDIFTDKQRRVLDLLIEHKTSKEIARLLGISPYTVDQRISLARAKLGVASRNELAARYRLMRTEHPAQGAGEEVPVAPAGAARAVDFDGAGSAAAMPDGEQDPTTQVRENGDLQDLPATMIAPSDETKSCPTDIAFDYRVGPEVFEGRSAGLWRMGAVVATALLLVVVILGLFAIFNQLSDMLSS